MERQEETKLNPLFSKGFFARHMDDDEVSFYISPSCKAYEVCIDRRADKTFILDTLQDIEMQRLVTWSCGTPENDTDILLDYFAEHVLDYEKDLN